MKNYDELVEINRSPNWSYIRDQDFNHFNQNMLLNLIKHHQSDINKIYLYLKDLFESKYQLLISRREKKGNKELENVKEFIDFTTNDVYENLEDYNSTKKRKVS